MDQRTIARWAFIVGLALAIIIGLVTDLDEWVTWVMIVLGLFACEKQSVDLQRGQICSQELVIFAKYRDVH